MALRRCHWQWPQLFRLCTCINVKDMIKYIYTKYFILVYSVLIGICTHSKNSGPLPVAPTRSNFFLPFPYTAGLHIILWVHDASSTIPCSLAFFFSWTTCISSFFVFSFCLLASFMNSDEDIFFSTSFGFFSVTSSHLPVN